MKIQKLTLAALLAVSALFVSCSSDDDDESGQPVIEPSLIEDLNASDIDLSGIVLPDTYDFTRSQKSSVSYSGQTLRLRQIKEILSEFVNTDATKSSLDSRFAGQGFNDPSLISSTNIRSKTANSKGLFGDGNAAIKLVFDGYISDQITVLDANATAVAGTAGNFIAGDKTRYVNGKGLELDQAFNKGLIGALVVDQALNHYTNRLDDDYNGSNNWRDDNDADTPVDGKDYTKMEHHWDEGYGYVYGVDSSDDKLLQKYINKVEADIDFQGIAKNISDAFLIGRAAIVGKKYDVRDAAIAVLRNQISTVVAIRTIYYLQQGKANVGTSASFHDLSEGYGFVYSLQFTTLDGKTPVFSATEVQGFLDQLEAGNGFWNLTADTLDSISSAIAAKFNFTVEQAGS